MLLLLALALATCANPVPFPTIETTPHTSPYLEPSLVTPALAHELSIAASTTPILLTCPTADCRSNCLAWSLQGAGYHNCFWAGDFISFQLLDPSRLLGTHVDIAPNDCTGWLAIPQQGVCYNIRGAVFHQYGTFDI
ncbi:hypothetical protein C8Q76DRAFT_795446 [Earliella scabrosa]|nr:hypothetical protein C8Q76DRAFT_795446 [Earliella scabrosa]